MIDQFSDCGLIARHDDEVVLTGLGDALGRHGRLQRSTTTPWMTRSDWHGSEPCGPKGCTPAGGDGPSVGRRKQRCSARHVAREDASRAPEAQVVGAG